MIVHVHLIWLPFLLFAALTTPVFGQFQLPLLSSSRSLVKVSLLDYRPVVRIQICHGASLNELQPARFPCDIRTNQL